MSNAPEVEVMVMGDSDNGEDDRPEAGQLPPPPPPCRDDRCKAEKDELHARLAAKTKLAESAVFKLSVKEQEVGELKRQLLCCHDASYIPSLNPIDRKKERGAAAMPSPLVFDPVLAHAFRRQAEETDRLRRELAKEREAKSSQPFDPNRLTTLRLVAKLHSLQEENTTLGKELKEAEGTTKSAALALHRQHTDQLRQALRQALCDVQTLQGKVAGYEKELGLSHRRLRRKPSAAAAEVTANDAEANNNGDADGRDDSGDRTNDEIEGVEERVEAVEWAEEGVDSDEPAAKRRAIDLDAADELE